jgi:hypothetical protein
VVGNSACKKKLTETIGITHIIHMWAKKGENLTETIIMYRPENLKVGNIA